MRNSKSTLLLLTTLMVLPAAAIAQAQDLVPEMAPAQAPAQGPPANLPPQPAIQPPPPPQAVQPPLTTPMPPLQAAQPASGQWVYTGEYGWIWMPFGNTCTYVPPDGSTPCMYVYYPVSGWCWVTAPWLWGCGPAPYFGIAGPRLFFWWGRGCGYWYGFRGGYRNWGWSARAYWGGRGWVGVGGAYRPAWRPGFGGGAGFRGGDGFRGGGGFRGPGGVGVRPR